MLRMSITEERFRVLKKLVNKMSPAKSPEMRWIEKLFPFQDRNDADYFHVEYENGIPSHIELLNFHAIDEY